MNGILVFVGPTSPNFSHSEIAVMPPAKRGDIFKALKTSPKTILLVDGYFGQEAAVMHRELLYAIQLGVQVVGCSSMGALRAAELYPHGMIGIGRIFDAFKNGEVTGDDEVALLHGPSELDYCQITFPLFNLRSTAKFASSEFPGMRTLFEQVVGIAEKIPFSDRTFEEIARALGEIHDHNSANRAISILQRLWVDQKRTDFEEALKFACSTLPDRKAHSPTRPFVETSWLRLQRNFGELESDQVNAKVGEALIRFHDTGFREHLLKSFAEATFARFSANICELNDISTESISGCISEYIARWPNSSWLGALGACVFLAPDKQYSDWLNAEPRKIEEKLILRWAASNETVVIKAVEKSRRSNVNILVEIVANRLTQMRVQGFALISNWTRAELVKLLLRTRPWATDVSDVMNDLCFHNSDEMLDSYRHIASLERLALSYRADLDWNRMEKSLSSLEELYFFIKDINE